LAPFERDLFWAREVVPTEIRMLCEIHGWQLHDEVLQLSWHIFSGACNTKRTLEDTFNLLHGAAKAVSGARLDLNLSAWSGAVSRRRITHASPV
jgi:hypothetical protein